MKKKSSGGGSSPSRKVGQASNKPKPRTKAAYHLYPDGKVFWGMALVRDAGASIPVDQSYVVKTTAELVQAYKDLTAPPKEAD